MQTHWCWVNRMEQFRQPELQQHEKADAPALIIGPAAQSIRDRQSKSGHMV